MPCQKCNKLVDKVNKESVCKNNPLYDSKRPYCDFCISTNFIYNESNTLVANCRFV